MKTKCVIFVLGLLLLNSCIVKSINPFYVKEKIQYDKNLEGDWKSKNGEWKIRSVEAAIREDYYKQSKEKKIDMDTIKLSKDDKELITLLKNTYIINYNYFEKEAMFIATPFKVGKDLFLDFTPFEYESEGMNSLAAQHLIKTHSVCLVEYNTDNNIKFKWLDEDIVKTLIDEHNLKIKHEKIGIEDVEDDIVLTATSEELYRFLEKFMSSNIEEKWEKDQTYTLNKIDARP